MEAMPSLEDEASPDEGGGEKQDDKQDGKEDKGGKGVSADEFKEFKKGFDELKRERDELRESERYWSDRARTDKAGEKVKQDEVEKDDLSDLLGDSKDDDGDNDKFIDELTSDGSAALRKRGFISRKDALELAREVAERVAARASKKAVGLAEKKIQRGNELIRTFPFIEKEDSEEFKLASGYLKSAVARDPENNSSEGLWSACEKARDVIAERRKAEDSKGKSKKARMAAQADFGGASGMDDDDDEMSDLEKQTARRFGITDAEYRKHSTVNIGGIPGMRG